MAGKAENIEVGSYRRRGGSRGGSSMHGHGYLHGWKAYWSDKVGSLRVPPYFEPECGLPLNSQPRLQPKPIMAVQRKAHRRISSPTKPTFQIGHRIYFNRMERTPSHLTLYLKAQHPITARKASG